MSTLIIAKQTKSYEYLATNSNTKCNSRYFINSAISKTVLADMICVQAICVQAICVQALIVKKFLRLFTFQMLPHTFGQ